MSPKTMILYPPKMYALKCELQPAISTAWVINITVSATEACCC